MSELKGINSRLDELQAAVLRVRLRHLERWNRRRAEIAAIYLEALGDRVVTPAVAAWTEPVWHLFVIGVNGRDKLREELGERGIGTLVHYLPLVASDTRVPRRWLGGRISTGRRAFGGDERQPSALSSAQ